MNETVEYNSTIIDKLEGANVQYSNMKELVKNNGDDLQKITEMTESINSLVSNINRILE
jgi:methyl-accepting chemotaxis protein